MTQYRTVLYRDSTHSTTHFIHQHNSEWHSTAETDTHVHIGRHTIIKTVLSLLFLQQGPLTLPYLHTGSSSTFYSRIYHAEGYIRPNNCHIILDEKRL